jgi:hypothetical protein
MPTGDEPNAGSQMIHKNDCTEICGSTQSGMPSATHRAHTILTKKLAETKSPKPFNQEEWMHQSHVALSS